MRIDHRITFRKVVKIIAIGVGFLALLFVVVAGIAIAVIDPNDFRDDIEELAEQHIDPDALHHADRSTTPTQSSGALHATSDPSLAPNSSAARAARNARVLAMS